MTSASASPLRIAFPLIHLVIMFANTVQPALIDLLNSSSIPALSPLWTSHTDAQLPEDSTVCVLMDDEPVSPSTRKPVTQGWESSQQSHDAPQAEHEPKLSLIPKHTAIGSLSQPVIHIQSPTIRTTYIQSGARSRSLGIALPWLGIQFRRLGTREVSLEIGIVDGQGNEGRIRCSSFQVRV